MKSVTYHQGIKQSPDLHGLAEQATHRLNEEVGPAAAQVEAEWDATAANGGRQRLVTLTLREPPEEARGSFAAEDLANPQILGFRLRAVWRDLLRQQTHRLMREFDEGAPGES
jgi:hypothetical protein